MRFVNRAIEAKDRDLYQLDQAEASKPLGVLLPELNWTVDDDRQVYLRGMGSTVRGADPEPNPKSIGHWFHFHVNNTTYLIAAVNDLTRRISRTCNQHWALEEHWVLNDIDPRDEFTSSPACIRVLMEAMEASLGGNAYMAMRVARDGWTSDYKLHMEVALALEMKTTQ